MYLNVFNVLVFFLGLSIAFLVSRYLRGSDETLTTIVKRTGFITAIAFGAQLVDIPKIKQVLGIGISAPSLQIAKVDGQVASTGETFVGAAWAGPVTHPGIFVETSFGTQCMGAFRYFDRRQGDGHFQCDDGRTGQFQFTADKPLTGNGSGKLGSEVIRFSFQPDA